MPARWTEDFVFSNDTRPVGPMNLEGLMRADIFFIGPSPSISLASSWVVHVRHQSRPKADNQQTFRMLRSQPALQPFASCAKLRAD